MPTPFARGVRTVFELPDSLTKGRIGVLRHVELDYGGSTVFHDGSHTVAGLLKRPGVVLSENVVRCGVVGSSPPYSVRSAHSVKEGASASQFR